MIRDLASKSNAIFISKAIESYYLKKYKFKSSTVIYDQIDYDKKVLNSNPRFVNSKVSAIIVGQLIENKGIMDAVKAASKIYKDGFDFTLDVYGKGPLEDEIEKYIRDNNISNVHLKGFNKNISVNRQKYDMALICSKMESCNTTLLSGLDQTRLANKITN